MGDKHMENGTRQALFVIAGRFDPNCSAMRFGDPTGNMQTQSGSAAFKLGFSARMMGDISQASELVENNGLVFRIDPDPGIVNDDLDKTRQFASIYRYATIIRSVLDRIGEDVPQYL